MTGWSDRSWALPEGLPGGGEFRCGRHEAGVMLIKRGLKKWIRVTPADRGWSAEGRVEGPQVSWMYTLLTSV